MSDLLLHPPRSGAPVPTTLATPAPAPAPTPASPVAAALRAPGVARLLALSLVARAPEAVLGLLFILRVRDLGGSYALGGAVAAAGALGIAAGAPLLGRAIDRRGQLLVLTVSAVVAAATLLAAGLLPAGTSPLALLPLAVIGGAAQPPVAACLRTLFRRMLPDPDVRHAALAVEASLQELSFMVGPLVFVSLVAAHDPALGMVFAAAALLLSTLAFAGSRPSRTMPALRSAGSRGGALRSPAIRTLLAVGLGVGATFGAAEVTITAAAEHAGGAGTVGLLLAAYGTGSLIAGLYAASRGASPHPIRTLTVLLVAAAAGHGLLAVTAGNLWALGGALMLAGAAVAPLFAVVYALTGELAAKGTTTEAYTWLGSGIFAGAGLGSALGGVLIDGLGVASAFALAAATTAAAALVVWLAADSLRAS
ncbi:MFS transporter [Patulibacter defluvii]|uniref:MFS transporter n=1 Tax=Patulibacter defluvii TaxID=3095358 RepID=UPI002A74E8C4|nr:MFS transporter [Patulibacter sp. DM4]